MSQVSGYVNADGSMQSGQDFSVTRASAGVYSVAINTGIFSVKPIVLVECETGDRGYVVSSSLSDVDKDQFTVAIQNLAGQTHDSAFCFLATEPS